MSVQEFQPEIIAAACVFIACKLEEHIIQSRYVVSTFHSLLSPPTAPPLDANKPEYWELKKELFNHEIQVLRTLGFMVQVEHPHKYVLSYMRFLNGTKELAQAAWSVANDTLRTDLCTRYTPSTIACAAIYIGSRMAGVPLPEAPEERAWWHLFDATHQEIQDICSTMEHLYSLGKPRKWNFDVTPHAPVERPVLLPPQQQQQPLSWSPTEMTCEAKDSAQSGQSISILIPDDGPTEAKTKDTNGKSQDTRDVEMNTSKKEVDKSTNGNNNDNSSDTGRKKGSRWDDGGIAPLQLPPPRESRQNERNKENDSNRDRDRDRDRERYRDRSRSRSRDRHRGRSRSRSNDRDSHRKRDRSRDRERHRDRSRSRSRSRDRDRDRDRHRNSYHGHSYRHKEDSRERRRERDESPYHKKQRN